MKTDITYMPVELEFDNLEQIAAELNSVPDEYWFFSPYRDCNMLSLYSGGGKHKRSELMQHNDDFSWTEPALEYCTVFIEFTEKHIHTWLKPAGRIIVIQTAPGESISLHVDCSADTYNDLQHKFRLVPQGKKDTLWFKDRNGNKHFIDGKHPAYILDGSHPHGMDNNGDEIKYTICWGSPWNGENTEYDRIVEQNIDNPSTILRDDIGRVFEEQLFQEVKEGKEYWKNDYEAK